ncbi:MAG: 4-fold beta flower protein [Candidatus Hodarchaeota archaeon]
MKKCVLFTKDAIGGPEKMMKDIAPVKNQQYTILFKKPRENKIIEFIIKQEWSELAVKEFFYQ